MQKVLQWLGLQPLPVVQQYCPVGQSDMPLQTMLERDVQLAPGGRQVNTAFVPVLLGSVAQQEPPLFATAQTPEPHGTVAWMQEAFRHSFPRVHPPVLRSEQVVPQAVPDDAQVKLPGHMFELLAGMQVPAPLHLPAGVIVAPLQLALPHEMPLACRRQEPVPSQVPSWPQVFELSTAHSLSGSVPVFTARQRPFVLPVFADEQAMQSAGQLFSQQTLSMHAPVLHWFPVVQGPPFPLLGVQMPALQ